MTKVIADADLAAQLAGRKNLLFCDEAGKVLGIFSPAPAASEKDLKLEPQVSEEELDRRCREDERFTTEQVLARLRSL